MKPLGRFLLDAFYVLCFFAITTIAAVGAHLLAHLLERFGVSITEDTVSEAMDNCMADVDYSITESYTRATENIYRKKNIFKEVLAACALADLNALGQFTAASVEAPLTDILRSEAKVPQFAFHMNEMCTAERGNVFRKTGERRTFQYHFLEAAMQPYVIMKSLKDGVITKATFEKFYVTRQRQLAI